jgi:hypothetical protein
MFQLIEIANSIGLEEVISVVERDPKLQGILVSCTTSSLTNWFDTINNPYYYLTQNDLDSVVSPVAFKFPSQFAQSNLVITLIGKPGVRDVSLPALQPALVRYEVRPLSMLANSLERYRPILGGISIGAASSKSAGTLGGILRDNSGNSYGITCGHVVGNVGSEVLQPAKIDSKESEVVGHVSYKKYFTTNSQLDFAVINLNTETSEDILNVGRVFSVTRKEMINPCTKVEFNGRSSGLRRLRTGSIGATYKLYDKDKNEFIVRNLIQIEWGNLFDLAYHRPVQSGDSGAWLTLEGENGPEWCGLVVAEDRLRGWAIPSEDIMNHLAQNDFILKL